MKFRDVYRDEFANHEGFQFTKFTVRNYTAYCFGKGCVLAVWCGYSVHVAE